MKDTNGDTNNHELWLYYTSGIICASIIFNLFCGNCGVSYHCLSYLRDPVHPPFLFFVDSPLRTLYNVFGQSTKIVWFPKQRTD